MNALEVYVLCGSRSSSVARRFLQAIATERQPVAEDFPFPEFSERPERTFSDPMELIELLESRPNDAYSIYWNVEDTSYCEQAMLFFTEDGGMIAGIGGPSKSVAETLTLIGAEVGGDYGYVSSGSCPPSTIPEFKKICEESTLDNLFEGEIRPPRQTM